MSLGSQVSSCPWNDRKRHVRGIHSIVVNGLDRWQQYSLSGEFTPRVGMVVKAWEIAAGDLQTDAMTLLKDIAGGPEVDRVGVYLAGLNELWTGG